jgi:asparagine synthase (glutamine-hydrolysing)
MCGVVGGLGVSDELLAQGVEALVHRGPDARGAVRVGDVGLGHTRLSILDLDARSNQPFTYGAVTLSYNGELWNYRELRDELAASGKTFTTTGDTEVVAAALNEWGVAALPKLNGMFAMVWSSDGGASMHAARDRYGECPLHATTAGPHVVASERKALLAMGLDAHVRDVAPGEVLTANGSGWSSSAYYDIPLAPLPDEMDQSVGRVRELLTNGTEERLIADVPVCVLLSGGIDSSAIAAVVAQHIPDLVGYTAVYDDRSRDLRCAREVAERLGIKLIEVPVRLPTVADLERVVWAIEMPYKAQIEIGWPSIKLAEAMQADGFKVAFSGEGSDELWASYGFAYHALKTKDWHAYRKELFLGSASKNFMRANKIFMAHGVECRLPFLHPPFVEYAIGLTEDAVRAPKRPKAVLQDAFRDLVPASVVKRPKVAFQDGMGIKKAITTKHGPPLKRYRAAFQRMFIEAKQETPVSETTTETTPKAKPKRTLRKWERRYETMGQEAVCEECGTCPTAKLCEPARTAKLRDYGGIRLTADGFDCALPVTIDSHSHCAYECAYCFSENLAGHVQGRQWGLGQMRLQAIDRIWRGEGGKVGETIRKALRFDKRNEHGFPCPVQLGGINDPCDEYERQQGWLLRFIELMVKYNQPVRISTKGNLLALPDYRRAIAKAPHLFWVAFSIITPDDELLAKVDKKAPNATERIKAMKAMSDLGCKTSLRFRPIMPGLSDRTPRHRRAYEDLINQCAEAGARAVSAEVAFVPTRFNAKQRRKWEYMEKAIGVPLGEVYTKLMHKRQACLRPSYQWTADIMHGVAEVSKHNGMTLGVSDPIWKQLTESGCCCGILPEDPVFGNWEVENATNALLKAKQDRNLVLRKEDVIPPWAYETLQTQLCHMGAGPLAVYKARHKTWADKLTEIWNNLLSERGPLSYFQGALEPVNLPDGEIGYRYVGLERGEQRAPYWRVMEAELKDHGRPPECNACGVSQACNEHCK